MSNKNMLEIEIETKKLTISLYIGFIQTTTKKDETEKQREKQPISGLELLIT